MGTGRSGTVTQSPVDIHYSDGVKIVTRKGMSGKPQGPGIVQEGPAPDSTLDSLRVGEKLEARPLRRDLTLSPPQKSPPIALEHNDENRSQLKVNSVSKDALHRK